MFHKLLKTYTQPSGTTQRISVLVRKCHLSSQPPQANPTAPPSHTHHPLQRIFFYRSALLWNSLPYNHSRIVNHFAMLSRTTTDYIKLLQKKRNFHIPLSSALSFYVLQRLPDSTDRLIRAYSFCAVFLFRFINRNRNKRVKKEQFSSERNNFHGNKMAHSLILNRKGKKYEKIIRERSSKNTGGIFRQTSCLRRPRFLLRSFSSVLELVFMDTITKWRAAAVLTSVLFEGKVVRKMRNT